MSEIPDLALNDNTVDVVLLEFDDIDHMPMEGSASWNVLGKNPILFAPEMARKVVDKLKDTGVQAVVVHCEAGISRSAGMAAAIAKHFNGDDSEFFNSPTNLYAIQRSVYSPNRLVYRVMLDALHES